MDIFTKKIYINSVGIKLTLFTGLDLTTATKTLIYCKKPDGRVEECPAIIDPEDNKRLMYISKPNGNSGYQDCNLLISNLSDTTTLQQNITYSFIINDIIYNINFNIFPITYQILINKLNSILNRYNIIVEIVQEDLRFRSNIYGKNSIINLRKVEEGNCLFTQLGVTTFPDSVPPQVATFDIDGDYSLQAYVEMDGLQSYGETAILKIYKPFE